MDEDEVMLFAVKIFFISLILCIPEIVLMFYATELIYFLLLGLGMIFTVISIFTYYIFLWTEQNFQRR